MIQKKYKSYYIQTFQLHPKYKLYTDFFLSIYLFSTIIFMFGGALFVLKVGGYQFIMLSA